jgi:hypothetical protein
MTITKPLNKLWHCVVLLIGLLSGAYKPELAEQLLSDYRSGGKRGEISQSLYKIIDELEGK